MHKVLKSVLAIAVLASVSFADTIIMRNGHNVENARILRVGDEHIEFRIGNEPYTLPRADVAQIRYDDGRVEEFGARQPRQFVPPQAAPAASAPQAASAPARPQRERSAETGSSGGTALGAKLSLDQYRVGTAGTGWGFAGGLSLNIPLKNSVNLRPELGFTYRVPTITPIGALHYPDNSDDPDKVRWDGSNSIREFAISVPVMIHTASRSSRLNFETGLQFDIPFGTTNYVTTPSGQSSTNNNYSISFDRRAIDIGIAYGVAMRLSDDVSIGLRGVSYLNTPSYTGIYGDTRYNALGLNIHFNLARF